MIQSLQANKEGIKHENTECYWIIGLIKFSEYSSEIQIHKINIYLLFLSPDSKSGPNY